MTSPPEGGRQLGNRLTPNHSRPHGLVNLNGQSTYEIYNISRIDIYEHTCRYRRVFLHTYEYSMQRMQGISHHDVYDTIR